MSPPAKLNCTKSTINLNKINSFFPKKNIRSSSSDKDIKNKKPRSLSIFFKKKEKIKIIWSEGGKEVYLTGTFCNWDKFYLMEKDTKNDFFYIILDLPQGFNQFKFKVDGQWKNSSIYPKLNNHGNINNYLEITHKNNDNTNESTVETSSISNINKNNNINDNIIIDFNSNKNNKNIINNLKIDFSFSKKNYCNYYPKKNEMREFTDKKPSHFQTECYHGVNETQNKIGNKNHLFLKENEIYSGNYSYKTIERKDHVLLNHLCQRQNNNNKKNETFINSVTIKYRHKNTTFLYYK